MTTLVNEARARQLMANAGIDAIVGTTIENTYYLAGLWSLASAIFPRDSQVYALVAADAPDKPYVVVPTTDADCLFESFIAPTAVFPYGTFFREVGDAHLGPNERQLKEWVIDRSPYLNPLEALAGAIESAGLTTGHLAIDERAFDPSYFEGLASRFPRARFSKGFQLSRDIRAVKSREEIARLRHACEVNEQAMDAAVQAAKEGMTEREMLIVYRTSVVQQGGIPVFDGVNFGSNTGFGNLYSTERKLRKGDHIRFDVGCRVNGYVSDLARIISYGEPIKRVSDYYMALVAGTSAGVHALRPGVAARAIFDLVVTTVREQGIPHYRRHHTGHGIGIEVYQPPLIAPASADVIEEGMVFAMEAPYFELGFGGLQVEDMVCVTAAGAEYLCTPTRQLAIVNQ